MTEQTSVLVLNSPRLSPREQMVCQCLVRALPNKMIAYELGISEGTVKVYVSVLLAKLGLPNRTALALWAARRVS